jgi:predicted transcriptional regulator
MKSALSGIPVSRAMVTNFESLEASATLSQAVQRILAGAQQDFPILDDGQVVGVLTKKDLLIGLNEFGDQIRVNQVMQRDFKTADSHEMLETALTRLQNCGCHTLPVFHHDQFVGLVTMDNIGEFIRIQSTLTSKMTA